MSRSVLIPLGITLVAVLIMTWHSAALPATVVVINSSGTALANVVVAAGDAHIALGSMRNGETRRATVQSGSIIALTFHGLADKRWESAEPLTAARTVVLYVTPGDHVDARDPLSRSFRP